MFKNSPTRRTLMPSISSGARAIWLGESRAADASTPALQPTSLTEDQDAELVGVYRNEYLIRLEWREGSLMFHDEGTSYRKPSDWITLKRLSDAQYLLVKPHLPYGTDLSVVRSTNGAVTHIVHSGRAFRKER
jgi:hypothetical protein